MFDYRSVLKEICKRKEYDDQKEDICVALPGVCMQELREYQDRTGRPVAGNIHIGGHADFLVSIALDYSDLKGDEQYEYILWMIRNAYDLLLGSERVGSIAQFFTMAEEQIENIPDKYAAIIHRIRKDFQR